MLAAYMIYAAVRILGLGDAATYNSMAFFLYAALFCVALFAIQPSSPLLGWFGSGSYFLFSGTSSSSWRCAITPRCVSSAVSPALPFAAA